MAEEQVKQEAEVAATETAPEPAVEQGSTPVKDVSDEKDANLPPEEKPDDSKALAIVEKPEEIPPKKTSGGSLDRDIALADLEKAKKISYIKAWEENEKTKAENRAQKKLSSLATWESRRKAEIEAKLRNMEEQLEKKKAEYAEKMKNKVAIVHKEAEERRAVVEAQKGEALLKAEETAAKHRATGSVPKKGFGCF